MGWLTDGIVEFISSVYSGLFHGFSTLLNMAKLSPEGFNKTLWDAVTTFSHGAVLPVAWSILSLFLLMELAQHFKRSNAKGMESIYWIGLIFLKIAIAKLVMDNMDTIINAIFQIVSTMITNGTQFVVTDKMVDSNTLSDALEGANIVTLLGYMIESLIIRLGSEMCFLLSKIVIQLRFIEIYVFTAVAPLPFATLPSDEYGQIGKSYIKRMSALAIHALFIVIVLYMYSVLLNGAIFNVTDANVTGAMWEALGYSILCVIALFQTGGWAKSLCQAN